MRVTDKILQNNFLANLNYATERLYHAETRALTGRRITKPSDDPVDTITSLAIRTRVSEIEQYQRNISRSKTKLENTETLVTEMADLYQRVSTLVVQGASDSTGPEDRISISYEINQILEQVFSIANSKSESTYVFAGTTNNIQPYIAQRNAEGEIEGVTTSGTAGSIMSNIGQNVSIKINTNGEDLFEQGENLFNLLIDIRDNLRNGNSSQIGENLNNLDEASEKIFNMQAIIGSRVNRVESAEARAENDLVNFTEYLSNVEDADSAEAIIDYQLELTTLQASLEAGSRLQYPKLSDFLG